MTIAAEPRGRSRPDGGGEKLARATWRRVAGLLATEFRLFSRFGVFAAAAVVTALWVAILLVVPAEARAIMVPLVLLTDVSALGFLFVPAVLVLERAEGVEAAMRLTPLRACERLGIRIGLSAALSVLAATAVTLAGRTPAIPAALLAVATSSALMSLVAFTLIGSSPTLTTLLTRAPFVAAPLIAPALAYHIGLSRSPLLLLSPVTSAVRMMAGTFSWSGLGWQLLCVGGAAAIAARVASRPPSLDQPPASAPAPRRAPAHAGTYAPWAAVRSFARADRRVLVRDSLLIMLAVSVPLVAVAARVIGGAGVALARRRYGLDLTPHLPVVWALLLILHTPIIFGALTGLLLLEDRDARLLPAIATTRASVVTLLAYRLAVTAGATAIALALSLPLAGVIHPAGAVGLAATVAAAAALSALPALLLAAVAGNRVQAVAVMKIVGLPLYLPLASWFVTPPARWLFAPLPSAWTAWSSWAATPTTALATAAIAVSLSATVSLMLARRFLRVATSH